MGSLNKASLSQCSEDTLFLWNRQDRNWEWPSLSRKKNQICKAQKKCILKQTGGVIQGLC